MTGETVTIYDGFNRPQGTAQRSDVHSKGLWHRSVNFIVLDPIRRTVVFQDSNALDECDVDSFFVKMNGGHAQSEDMLREVARELEEELGLDIESAESVHLLGKYQISFEPTKDFINREFMYFYLVAFRDAFAKINMDGIEVKSVFEVNIDEAVDLLTGEKATMQVTGRDVFGKYSTLSFTDQVFKNFTDDALYLRLFLAAQDFCNGRNKKHIVI